MGGVDVFNCDSKYTILVRTADIVANCIHYMALNCSVDKLKGICCTENLYFHFFLHIICINKVHGGIYMTHGMQIPGQYSLPPYKTIQNQVDE